jgi:hypothetical protein
VDSCVYHNFYKDNSNVNINSPAFYKHNSQAYVHYLASTKIGNMRTLSTQSQSSQRQLMLWCSFYSFNNNIICVCPLSNFYKNFNKCKSHLYVHCLGWLANYLCDNRSFWMWLTLGCSLSNFFIGKSHSDVHYLAFTVILHYLAFTVILHYLTFTNVNHTRMCIA